MTKEDQSRSDQPQSGSRDADPRDDVRARIVAKGQGWCTFTHSHDNSKAALAAAREALTIIEERITSKFTPALNHGTAMDALILVAEAQRELQAELTDGEGGS